jgi:phosphoribosylformylglycinamidine synthase subunit PurL
MTPYEIMLSESQERMLLVVKRGREAEVERIFDKWDLHASHIGEVTSDGMLRVKERGTVVAEIPNRALTDEAPVYHRPMARPEYLVEAQRLDLDELAASPGANMPPGDTLLALLASPAIGSKRWVYRQYDHMVRTNTINMPGMGAGVVRIKETNRALAMSVDGNGRYSYLDPRHGAMLAVAEAARNVACAGGKPLAATNCLNFGNPERPGIMWQLAQAVEGIGEACRALDTPITGGNVSLYNETDGRAIYPTPVIGIVGLLEHADRVVTRRFQAAGDVVVLLGESRGELGGSEYLKVVHGLVRGRPPALDLEAERKLQALLVDLACARLMRSAHDCSDGGLAVTLAESAFDTDGIGVDVSIDGVGVAGAASITRAAALFGESASRVVVSAAPAAAAEVVHRATAAGVPARIIGRTGGRSVRIAVGGDVVVDVALADAERAWADAVQRYFAKRVA